MIDYSRVTFEDFPSIRTPLNQRHLNIMDKAIYDIDQGLGDKSSAASVDGNTVFAKIGSLYTSLSTLNTKVTNKVTYNGSAVTSIDFSVDGTTLTITTTT